MTKQQVMSPSPPEDPPAALLDALDNAKSVSAEISEPSEHGTSECGTDRLDRMERLIGDLMRDMVRERVERTQLPLAEPESWMGIASSVFAQFLDARRH